jgi:hypothetical protein
MIQVYRIMKGKDELHSLVQKYFLQTVSISNRGGRLRKPYVTLVGGTVATQPILEINFHGRLH